MTNSNDVSPSSSLVPAHTEITRPSADVRPVFIIRWMEHEYEPGWGVGDKEDCLMIYPSKEAAQESVEDHFRRIGRRSLLGAGNYFCYPSGPDDGFNLYKIMLSGDCSLFSIFETHKSIIIPRIPSEESDRIYRRLIIEEMQSNRAELVVVPFHGLAPKPLTSDPVFFFPSPSPR